MNLTDTEKEENAIGAGLTNVRRGTRLVNTVNKVESQPVRPEVVEKSFQINARMTNPDIRKNEEMIISNQSLQDKSDNNSNKEDINNKEVNDEVSENKEIEKVLDKETESKSDNSENKGEEIPNNIETLDDYEVEEVEEKLDHKEVIRQGKLEVRENLEKVENSRIRDLKDIANDSMWIPVDNLPTNGKVFDIHRTVYYRRYNFGDFEDINNSEISLVDQYNLALAGIKCTNLPSKMLLPFYDFSFISVLRRLDAQGAKEFVIPYQCNTCGQVGAFKFTLDKIDFNACNIELPIKVRFRSYPDTVFEFMPHTIGDVLELMREGRYYKRKPDGSYQLDVTDSYIPDELATLAISCITYSFEEAYHKLTNVFHRKDYDVIKKVINMLKFGIKPFEFKCEQFLPNPEEENKVEEENEKKLNILTQDGDDNVPSFLKYVEFRKKNRQCGAINTIDILGGDVIILPFRESEDSSEYGILSV